MKPTSGQDFQMALLKPKRKTDWSMLVFIAWMLAAIAFIGVLVAISFLSQNNFDRRSVSSTRFPKRTSLAGPSVISFSLPEILKATANVFRRDARTSVSDLSFRRPITPVCSLTPVGTYEPDLTGVIRFDGEVCRPIEPPTARFLSATYSLPYGASADVCQSDKSGFEGRRDSLPPSIRFMQGRTRGVPVAHNHVQRGATPRPATICVDSPVKPQGRMEIKGCAIDHETHTPVRVDRDSTLSQSVIWTGRSLPSCDGDRRRRTSLHSGEITALTAG